MCGGNAILQWRAGPNDTNVTRTLRSGANGCRVTDRHPQEGPSFRTGLDGPPLILVVQFAGVHGNRGIIIINTGFKFSRGEWQLPGMRMGTTNPPWGAAVPVCEDQGPPCGRRLAPGSGPLPQAGPRRQRGQEGAAGAVSEARSSCGGPRGAELISQTLQRGPHARALAAHNPPPRACDSVKPGVCVPATEFPSSSGRLAP